jgi:hypothetical protein
MTDVKKLSFAKVSSHGTDVSSASTDTELPKVLASAPTEEKSISSSTRDAASHPVTESQLPTSPKVASESVGEDPVVANGAQTLNKFTATGVDDGFDQNKLVDGLDNLKIEPSAPSLVINGINSASTGPSSKAQSPLDEVSQKADSSSELGTKPPSLDGKSITSGTTFNALDEKESLRPDDSASVMAADQDDDVFSIRGSLIAGSRMGSEVAARVYRIQLGDMPPRSVAPQHVIVESGNRAVTAPQSVSMEQQPVTDAKIALVGATSAPNGMYGQNPDEKLLEAMQSQKDRFFLLKLEEMVIEFVQDSK